MQPLFTKDLIAQSMSYESYKNLITTLAAEEKTTGPNQSDALVMYSQLNIKRMRRVEKTFSINETTQNAVNQVNAKWIWIVLAEAWCGDVPANLPVIEKMASLNPNISLHILLRDENLPIIDAFLTNGGRSIPKLICLNADTLEVLGSWGPRPVAVQQMVLAYKATPKEEREDYMELVKKAQLWYAKDKGKTLQEEFRALFVEWGK